MSEQEHGSHRPGKWDPAVCPQVTEWCEAGYTDREVADSLGINITTIWKWQKAHPEFAKAMIRGKEIADVHVEQALYKRALGYSHPAVKIAVSALGQVTEVPYTEHYPPDTVACIFWLKNRKPAEWRDKREIEQTIQVEQARINAAVKQFLDRCPDATEAEARSYLAAQLPDIKDLGTVG